MTEKGETENSIPKWFKKNPKLYLKIALIGLILTGIFLLYTSIITIISINSFEINIDIIIAILIFIIGLAIIITGLYGFYIKSEYYEKRIENKREWDREDNFLFFFFITSYLMVNFLIIFPLLLIYRNYYDYRILIFVFVFLPLSTYMLRITFGGMLELNNQESLTIFESEINKLKLFIYKNYKKIRLNEVNKFSYKYKEKYILRDKNGMELKYRLYISEEYGLGKIVIGPKNKKNHQFFNNFKKTILDILEK